MKQIRFFLYAAISALAVASCAKEAELVEPEAIASGEKTLLTLSLGSSETKTALVGGKTTWTAGDVVRIYNATGTFSQDVEVPASASANKLRLSPSVAHNFQLLHVSTLRTIVETKYSLVFTDSLEHSPIPTPNNANP